MSIKFIFVYTLFFLLPFLSFTQTPELAINQIEFKGQNKIKVAFLKNNIRTTTGVAANSEHLKTDIQFLKNIPGVKNAEYSLDTINQKIKLIYHIEEITTALPIINFGGIKDNFWFRTGYSDNNWRGLGQTLVAYYQNNDGKHGAKLFFRTPQMTKNKWGFALSINKWSSIEPLFFSEGTVQYDYDNNGISFSPIYSFDRRRSLEVGGNIFRESYRQNEFQILENPPGPLKFSQTKLLTKIEYKENFIKYDYFYRTGFDWFINFQNVYNTIDKNWFNSVGFQYRLFLKPNTTSNLATRVSLAISTNNDSPFAPFVADSHLNIRGIGNRIDRGTAQAVINLEWRQTILHKGNVASQLIVFSDLGSWRNPGGQLSDVFDTNELRHFIGGGLRVIYQQVFGAILRIDYGLDVYDTSQKGIVIGLGQYF